MMKSNKIKLKKIKLLGTSEMKRILGGNEVAMTPECGSGSCIVTSSGGTMLKGKCSLSEEGKNVICYCDIGQSKVSDLSCKK